MTASSGLDGDLGFPEQTPATGRRSDQLTARQVRLARPSAGGGSARELGGG